MNKKKPVLQVSLSHHIRIAEELADAIIKIPDEIIFGKKAHQKKGPSSTTGA